MLDRSNQPNIRLFHRSLLLFVGFPSVSKRHARRCVTATFESGIKTSRRPMSLSYRRFLFSSLLQRRGKWGAPNSIFELAGSSLYRALINPSSDARDPTNIHSLLLASLFTTAHSPRPYQSFTSPPGDRRMSLTSFVIHPAPKEEMETPISICPTHLTLKSQPSLLKPLSRNPQSQT
jgi:hypothetical protein